MGGSFLTSQRPGAGAGVWPEDLRGGLAPSSQFCGLTPSGCHSVVSNSVTPWTVARQAPLSVGFSRPEYWSGWPFPFQGIFPTQGSNPGLRRGRRIPSRLSHQGSSDFQRSPVLLVYPGPLTCSASQPLPGKRKKVKSLGCVRLFATPWTIAYQAPLSMGLPRQEYWNGLPFPSPGDLPDPGIEPVSPAL